MCRQNSGDFTKLPQTQEATIKKVTYREAYWKQQKATVCKASVLPEELKIFNVFFNFLRVCFDVGVHLFPILIFSK